MVIAGSVLHRVSSDRQQDHIQPHSPRTDDSKDLIERLSSVLFWVIDSARIRSSVRDRDAQPVLGRFGRVPGLAGDGQGGRLTWRQSDRPAAAIVLVERQPFDSTLAGLRPQ